MAQGHNRFVFRAAQRRWFGRLFQAVRIAVTGFTLGASLAPQTAHAQTAFSNFGPGDTYDADGRGYIIGPSLAGSSNYVTAFEFTSAASGVVSSYDAALARIPVSGGSSPFVFRLYTDNGGSLGSLLDTGTAANVLVLPYNSPAIYNLASVSHPTLTMRNAYWLLASSVNTSYSWIIAAAGTTNENTLASTSGGSSFTTNSQIPSAYRVNLDTTGTATAPEPGALTLLALSGLPIIGTIARRQRSIVSPSRRENRGVS